MTGPAYARGDKAWGICGRCGLRALLNDLVEDKYFPGLIVHTECRDFRHPQERLKPAFDPIALWKPSPEVEGPSEPVLEALQSATTISLSWTRSIGTDCFVEGYYLYRAIEDGDPTLYQTFTSIYGWDRALLTETLAYDDLGLTPDVTYHYYVIAYDTKNRSAASNTVSGTAVTPE